MATFPYYQKRPITIGRIDAFSQATGVVDLELRYQLAVWLLFVDQGDSAAVELYFPEVQSRVITTAPVTGPQIRAYQVARNLVEYSERDSEWNTQLDVWLTEFTALTGISGTPTAPIITLQPLPQTITVGDTLTMSAAAGGALSQQWYLDGSPILGATSTTYSKANAQLVDDGDYFCRFTNATGTTDTNIVTSTVSAAPGGGGTLSFNGIDQYGTI